VVGGDGTRCPVRAPKTVEANDEEPRRVECPPWTSQQRTPPVRNISTSRQGMANNHGIVPIRRQLTPCGICHGDVVQSHPRFKGKGGDNCYLLIRNKSRKWVLRLRPRSFLQVFSQHSHWVHEIKVIRGEWYRNRGPCFGLSFFFRSHAGIGDD
jgi:hypothetical protein